VYSSNWGYPVKVSANNAARIHDPNHPLFGALAGSSLTMNRAMKNVHQWIHRPTQDLWAMGTANPARVAKLTDRGVIRENAHADLVLWNEDFTPARTWVGGRQVYQDAQ
jgi:N-acetylglucosamine-6-phosphate deacetylase